MKERLHDTVERRGRSAKILVLCGLGGAGKSQLTLSYIESYRDDYTAVFWIDAGAKARLEADYKKIRNLLHSSYRTDVDIDTCVAEVKQWCHQKQGRWLFVYDSADDVDDPQSTAYIDLRRIVVDALSADVIITTRSQSASDMTDLEAVQVAEMAPAEARDLFFRRSKLPSPSVDLCEEVDAIARELGFFALAINLAAAFVAETPRLRKHPGRYLDEYRRRRKALLDRKPKAHVDQYGSSVLTTWETSYAAIFDRCPEACNLLLFLAFLSPDDLFLDLLQTDNETIIRDHATWLLTEKSSASVQELLDSSFEMLRSYSLLLWRDEQSSYSMHKLVHAWSFERSENKSKVGFCEAALNFLNYYTLNCTDEASMSARMVPHITTCFTRVCEVYAESDVDIVGIVDGLKPLADFLSISAQSNWGYELYLFLHDHYRRIRCADQTDYFISVANLGRVMSNMGGYKAAVELLRPALSQFRESYGPDHRSELGAWIAQALGRALTKVGNYTEAESLLRRALGECDTPNDTLMTMHFLASVLSRLNRTKEAEQLSREAFDGMKRLFGPTHPITFEAIIGHADVLNNSGQYEESNSLTRQAVRDFEATFGPQHTYTMLCMAKSGISRYLLGDIREAIRLLRQAMLGLETAAGMDYPNTLQCVFDLAVCLRRH